MNKRALAAAKAHLCFAFPEGVQAFIDGKQIYECPTKPSYETGEWERGWKFAQAFQCVQFLMPPESDHDGILNGDCKMTDQATKDANLSKQISKAVEVLKEKLGAAKDTELTLYFWEVDGEWPKESDFGIDVTRKYKV